jgi:hypothetical protein
MKIALTMGFIAITILSAWTRLWVPFKSWWEQDDEKGWRQQEQERTTRSRWEPEDW